MLQPGTKLGGRYTVESLVAHGGMGAVYCARDERLGREVALKILRADLAADRAARARFLREGQIAAQIVHPNVVRTFDAGDDPAAPYLVQEFLTGQTLDQVVPLPPRRAAEIIRGVAAALGYIHSRGYVHCDVKPQNILLRNDGTPVLLDFGIARAEGTDTTTLIATPHYLAPERAQGAAPTAASDLYALGIVLFQALTGRPPFDAPAIHGIIQQHIETPVPPLPIGDAAAPVLDRIIARLTAKRPEDRYTSADSLQADLAAVEGNAVHAQPTITVARPAPAQTSQPPAPAPVQTSQPPAPLTRPPSPLAAWSAAPAWQKRRWMAVLLVPLLLLLLGYGLAQARRTPDVTPVLGTPATPTTDAATSMPVVAPESVTVPQVVGLHYSAAERLLAAQGLVASIGEEQPAPEAAGIVLQSEPPAATALPPGSHVVLNISAGSGEAVAPVPPPAVEPPVINPPAEEDKDENKGKDEDKGKGKGNGRKDD